jgi:hypothetical protein
MISLEPSFLHAYAARHGMKFFVCVGDHVRHLVRSSSTTEPAHRVTIHVIDVDRHRRARLERQIPCMRQRSRNAHPS